MSNDANKGKPKAATSPFAALASLRASLPAGQAPPAPATPASPASSPPAASPASALGDKLVVSRSKKGRGGKTVTTIAGVANAAAREALAVELRRALGCGASVDDALVVVQGDQVARVRAHLEARGVRKVVVGS